MLLNFIDRVGELNPQLFRELKGRLKGFNLIISMGSSLLLQLTPSANYPRLGKI
ncbi:hypothetical protein PN480_15090 [Dolichospermum circinale CS-1225]|uniref:Uncharacterized protein n=1 Tax=Dolichospermum circinale CS-537/01 TaxID=3021739 RepID=A0ABT5A9H4_9CYAN|nr:hypothetical protein [Dolichospermum circinale]MDB9465969.1 hypothetical protein [Dolichospermum circinale CS-539/09]MDB9471067.1 hypothetical protein [Dolichospermum circinale CS-539]MDB9488596.1 hypothetical protein [Dolichospermum circinale CS-537/01]MDB9523260.1 hypothetical protein [Dolichospermum circinale CS-1225]